MADSPGGWVEDLSHTLFWDVDQASVTVDQHLKWIVERVVERGNWDDWLLLNRHVSRSQLVSLLPRLKIPPRELAFLQAYLGVEGAS